MTTPADRTSSVDGAPGAPVRDAPTDTGSSATGATTPLAHPTASPDSLVGHTVRGREGGSLGRLTKVLPGPDGAPAWGVVKPSFGGARMVPLAGAAPGDKAGHLHVPVDRRAFRSAPTGTTDDTVELDRHYTGRGALTAARVHQYERFGGLKIGCAFFGWIVAVGLTVILAAIATGVAALTGAGPDLGNAVSGNGVSADVQTVGLVGGIVAVAILFLSYLAGGYVAGRLARFDGARNGVTTWVIGFIVTVAATIGTAIAGTQAGFAERLPGIALPDSTFTAGGLVALAVAVVVTLIGAVLGGKAGERFHHRVDRAGEAAL
ncbi:MAG: hypothetical protein OJJ54_00295 [Pseudonocardia sp.]|nr:hypothetical protein [Pseudonocardia sp.]